MPSEEQKQLSGKSRESTPTICVRSGTSWTNGADGATTASMTVGIIFIQAA